MTRKFVVTAQWDPEAEVWVAISEDIVGLVSESTSLDLLYARVTEIAPGLLAENGLAPAEEGLIDFHVLGPFTRHAAE